MANTSLWFDINSLPKGLRDEVAEFVAFLKKKAGKTPSVKRREFGLAKGKIHLAPDFDEPIDDFKGYTE